MVGCTGNPDCSVDFYHQVHYTGVSIVGAHNHARPRYESSAHNWTFDDDCEALLKLINVGRLDIKSLISEIHYPEEAHNIYDRLVSDYARFPVGVLFNWT